MVLSRNHGECDTTEETGTDPELRALLEKTAKEYIAKKAQEQAGTQAGYPKLVYNGPPSRIWEVLCVDCGKVFEANSPRRRQCAECAGLPTFGATYVPTLTKEVSGKEAKFGKDESEVKRK